VRAKPATEVSAASTSQLSIAVVNASRAFKVGTFDSSTGFIRQPFDSFGFWFCACELLNLSSAQNNGNQRSLSGPAIAAWCAEFTASTAWNLNPTAGRG